MALSFRTHRYRNHLLAEFAFLEIFSGVYSRREPR